MARSDACRQRGTWRNHLCGKWSVQEHAVKWCYLQFNLSLKFNMVFFRSIGVFEIKFTPRSTVLPEKLTGPRKVNKFPHFMESEISLPHSRESAICSYPEPDRSSPCPPQSYFLKILFNIILSCKPRFSKRSLSLGFSHQNPPMHLSCLTYVLHVLPISVFLT
jgi:hypothetical protein